LQTLANATHHSQHFQKIRKESRNSPGGGESVSPNKRANTNGVHKSTPRKGSKVHGSFEQSVNEEDDEEEFNTSPLKRKRAMKKEEGKENGEEQSVYLFKMEHGGDVIDLENDEYAFSSRQLNSEHNANSLQHI
jgi:hypothetical protein